MKITVVPAQVTTVEDKIMGSLSLSQLMILLLPVFIGAALFVILPPAMGSALYKYILIGILAVICMILSIRIKGKNRCPLDRHYSPLQPPSKVLLV
jgi:hypothetical protein